MTAGDRAASGINDHGKVVGYHDQDGRLDGFLLRGGIYTTIDVPGSLWTEIYSMNARGEIVGACEDANGIHGFKGKPAGDAGDE